MGTGAWVPGGGLVPESPGAYAFQNSDRGSEAFGVIMEGNAGLSSASLEVKPFLEIVFS